MHRFTYPVAHPIVRTNIQQDSDPTVEESLDVVLGWVHVVKRSEEPVPDFPAAPSRFGG